MPDERLMPPARHSRQHCLNQLNDENIVHILELLSFEDMCAFARTCKEFKRMCNRAFAKQYLARIGPDFPYWGMKQLTPLWRIEDYLFSFGHLVKQADTHNIGHLSRVAVGLAAVYCTNLRILECSVMEAKHGWNTFKRFFGPHSTVEHLTIHGIGDMLPLPEIEAPKLAVLKLDNCYILNNHAARVVFQANTNLRELAFKNSDIAEDAMEQIQELAKFNIRQESTQM